MKPVCDVLGVARSGATARRARPAHWRDGRSTHSMDDTTLIAELREAVLTCQATATGVPGACCVASARHARPRRSTLSGSTGSCERMAYCWDAVLPQHARSAVTTDVWLSMRATGAGARTALSSARQRRAGARHVRAGLLYSRSHELGGYHGCADRRHRARRDAGGRGAPFRPGAARDPHRMADRQRRALRRATRVPSRWTSAWSR